MWPNDQLWRRCSFAPASGSASTVRLQTLAVVGSIKYPLTLSPVLSTFGIKHDDAKIVWPSSIQKGVISTRCCTIGWTESWKLLEKVKRCEERGITCEIALANELFQPTPTQTEPQNPCGEKLPRFPKRRWSKNYPQCRNLPRHQGFNSRLGRLGRR